MLQQQEPDDYVIATGEAHSVQEFVAEAFKAAGLDSVRHVSTSPEHLRPTNTSTLIGDAGKARARFGFDLKVRFKDLVKLMVDADLKGESETARS